MLTGATAAFEGRLAAALVRGQHHLIIGHVAAVRLSDSPAALLYGQRTYRRAVHLPGAM